MDRPFSQRSAIVVGAAGQDGTYLGRHLEELGYSVFKVGRSTATIDGNDVPFDILDRDQTRQLVQQVAPDEIYYLAAYHHSAEEQQSCFPEVLRESMTVHFDGVVNVLQAIVDASLPTRLFLASSALVFGDPDHAPQTETTPIRPTTAYGVSKAAAMGACSAYRRQFGVFAAAGIFFNHESPLRTPKFVSKKIAQAAALASRGNTARLRLGALDVHIDWSAAQDAVRAAHAILQIDQAQDFVIASGNTHSVRDFAATAFAAVDLDYGRYVDVDETILQRSVASVPRHGDPSLLRKLTGFRPTISFEAMVRGMVEAELEALG